MNLEFAKQVADSVLYEGYLLYPYRASAVKNRQRFNFGVLLPPAYAQAQTGNDAWSMQTECLLEGDNPRLDVRLRFLQVILRRAGRILGPTPGACGASEPRYEIVPEIVVDGEAYPTWQEAIEREVKALDCSVSDLARQPLVVEWNSPAMNETETLRNAADQPAGVLIRRRERVDCSMHLKTIRLDERLWKVTVEVANRSACDARCTRDEALPHSLIAAHTILAGRQGLFASLLDPPETLKTASASCRNIGTWPVLLGSEGERDWMLSSPIILYDYPQIAAESAGSFFDGTEIDEMLTLRILTMTNEEKREMAATDPRTRELLDRTEAMTPAELARLHGALRSPRQFEGAPGGEDNAPWSTVDNKPRLASLQVGGTELTIGDRVRLDPKGRADIMDLVLKDKVAVVEAIECDFEDRVHLAVTIADDPGREMGFGHMPGHRFFFGPDEVQPLAPGSPE
jgi:hypothetical protein